MLRGVMTAKEASLLWGVPLRTLSSALNGQKGFPPRFMKGESLRSCGYWLITEEGMERLYGERKYQNLEEWEQANSK